MHVGDTSRSCLLPRQTKDTIKGVDPDEQKPKWGGILVTIVLAGLVVAGMMYFARPQVTPTSATPTPSPTTSAEPDIAGAVTRVDTISIQDSDMTLGVADAPITIIEFSDFECSYCGQFHQETFPLLQLDFIDTGKVRYVFKDFPLSNVHALAAGAANAAHCAGDQGKFWPYAAMLFTKQDALTANDLQQYAVDLGLDAIPFKVCVAEQKHTVTVAANVQAAIKAGITVTPSFIINDQLYEGALTYDALRTLLDAELNPSPTPQ